VVLTWPDDQIQHLTIAHRSHPRLAAAKMSPTSCLPLACLGLAPTWTRVGEIPPALAMRWHRRLSTHSRLETDDTAHSIASTGTSLSLVAVRAGVRAAGVTISRSWARAGVRGRRS
jgi:hypothetical protein